MIFMRLIGLVLLVLGLASALVTGVALISPEWVQPFYSVALPRIESPARSPQETSSPIAEGKPIGVIEIPRLGLSSVVLEGDESAALLFGVGHLSDTPLPWRGGNSVLAAHRDTFFRGLAGIRPKDVIRFRSGDRELEYHVRGTKIVMPTDVEVLKPTKRATLTLITCYPFRYIGPAPKRFIVIAQQVSKGEHSRADRTAREQETAPEL
ncbi:MAG TPA: class D sortase [Vicinamibacterales bacterium]|nr:class D sortase [Vicinamibacterales bacterium]